MLEGDTKERWLWEVERHTERQTTREMKFPPLENPRFIFLSEKRLENSYFYNEAIKCKHEYIRNSLRFPFNKKVKVKYWVARLGQINGNLKHFPHWKSNQGYKNHILDEEIKKLFRALYLLRGRINYSSQEDNLVSYSQFIDRLSPGGNGLAKT